MAEPSVCVVVCVHDALPDVRLCLASLKATDYPADRLRLVIVDDGSAEETAAYLRDFAAPGEASLIRHGAARGYTASANEGIRARGDADFVVLLNSDTIVPRGWLRRMLLVFETLRDVAIVGPLSNAATWQSVPETRNDAGRWAANDLPADWPIERVAEFVEASFAADPRIPRVPVLNGFCLMIRAGVFDRIGLLDEEHFPKGYGEENDLCFRATDAGLGLAVATNCFVFHAKSRSFGTATRDELAALGRQTLRSIYGDGRLNRASETMKRQPVLADVRARIAMGLRGEAAPADGALAAPALDAAASKAREVNAAVQRIFDDGATGTHEIDGNFALEVLEPASFKKHGHIRGSHPAGLAIEDGFATGPVFALRARDAEVDARAGLTLIDGGVIRCTTVTSKLVRRYRAQPHADRIAPREADGVIVPLGSLRMENYCRWWLESVAKLFLASRSALAVGDDGAAVSPKALMPKLSKRFQRDTAGLLAEAFEIVPGDGALARGASINSSGLCYAGGQRIGAMARDFSAFLAERTPPKARPVKGGPLVYVSRKRAKTRRVLNEEDLLPDLAALGFAALQLEELSLADQIATFRNAGVVVAPHGSGLANILFCRPGTKIVEILPEGGVHGSAYLRLASHLDLDYYFVVAPQAAHLTPLHDPVDADMAVDRGALIGFLRDVVAARQSHSQ